MGRNKLIALVAGTATLAGCVSSYDAPSKRTSNEPIVATPAQRTYRSGLETKSTFHTPMRDYGTPNADIEFELGSDSGESRQFEFAGIVINGANHRYGANFFREEGELGFVLKPDAKERIVFIEGNALNPQATARSEIDELYVFTPVLNAEGKPAREFKYSASDPLYGKKATFKRPNLADQPRGIMRESNENIILPDLQPVRINDTWYFTPLSSDGDASKSPFYLIEASGTEVGAERETGAVFLRTTRGIYRGQKITHDLYLKREEQRKVRDEAEAAARKAKEEEDARIRAIQGNNPGLIEIIK